MTEAEFLASLDRELLTKAKAGDELALDEFHAAWNEFKAGAEGQEAPGVQEAQEAPGVQAQEQKIETRGRVLATAQAGEHNWDTLRTQVDVGKVSDDVVKFARANGSALNQDLMGMRFYGIGKPLKAKGPKPVRGFLKGGMRITHTLNTLAEGLNSMVGYEREGEMNTDDFYREVLKRPKDDWMRVGVEKIIQGHLAKRQESQAEAVETFGEKAEPEDPMSKAQALAEAGGVDPDAEVAKDPYDFFPSSLRQTESGEWQVDPEEHKKYIEHLETYDEGATEEYGRLISPEEKSAWFRANVKEDAEMIQRYQETLEKGGNFASDTDIHYWFKKRGLLPKNDLSKAEFFKQGFQMIGHAAQGVGGLLWEQGKNMFVDAPKKLLDGEGLGAAAGQIWGENLDLWNQSAHLMARDWNVLYAGWERVWTPRLEKSLADAETPEEREQVRRDFAEAERQYMLAGMENQAAWESMTHEQSLKLGVDPQHMVKILLAGSLITDPTNAFGMGAKPGAQVLAREAAKASAKASAKLERKAMGLGLAKTLKAESDEATKVASKAKVDFFRTQRSGTPDPILKQAMDDAVETASTARVKYFDEVAKQTAILEEKAQAGALKWGPNVVAHLAAGAGKVMDTSQEGIRKGVARAFPTATAEQQEQIVKSINATLAGATATGIAELVDDEETGVGMGHAVGAAVASTIFGTNFARNFFRDAEKIGTVAALGKNKTPLHRALTQTFEFGDVVTSPVSPGAQLALKAFELPYSIATSMSEAILAVPGLGHLANAAVKAPRRALEATLSKEGAKGMALQSTIGAVGSGQNPFYGEFEGALSGLGMGMGFTSYGGAFGSILPHANLAEAHRLAAQTARHYRHATKGSEHGKDFESLTFDQQKMVAWHSGGLPNTSIRFTHDGANATPGKYTRQEIVINLDHPNWESRFRNQVLKHEISHAIASHEGVRGWLNNRLLASRSSRRGGHYAELDGNGKAKFKLEVETLKEITDAKARGDAPADTAARLELSQEAVESEGKTLSREDIQREDVYVETTAEFKAHVAKYKSILSEKGLRDPHDANATQREIQEYYAEELFAEQGAAEMRGRDGSDVFTMEQFRSSRQSGLFNKGLSDLHKNKALGGFRQGLLGRLGAIFNRGGKIESTIFGEISRIPELDKIFKAYNLDQSRGTLPERAGDSGVQETLSPLDFDPANTEANPNKLKDWARSGLLDIDPATGAPHGVDVQANGDWVVRDPRKIRRSPRAAEKEAKEMGEAIENWFGLNHQPSATAKDFVDGIDNIVHSTQDQGKFLDDLKAFIKAEFQDKGLPLDQTKLTAWARGQRDNTSSAPMKQLIDGVIDLVKTEVLDSNVVQARTSIDGKTHIAGRYLPEDLLDHLEQSGRWNPHQIEMLRDLNEFLRLEQGGTPLQIMYQSAKGPKGKYKTIGASERVVYATGFEITQQGNLVYRVWDLEKVMANAQKKLSTKVGKRLYGDDIGQLTRDVVQYFNNYARGDEGATGLTPEKRDFIRKAIGLGEPKTGQASGRVVNPYSSDVSRIADAKISGLNSYRIDRTNWIDNNNPRNRKVLDEQLSSREAPTAGSYQKIRENYHPGVEGVDEMGFYSPTLKSAGEKLPANGKIGGEQAWNILQKQKGVKEESKWNNLEGWLKSQKSVTRKDIFDYLERTEIKIEEDVRGPAARQSTFKGKTKEELKAEQLNHLNQRKSPEKLQAEGSNDAVIDVLEWLDHRLYGNNPKGDVNHVRNHLERRIKEIEETEGKLTVTSSSGRNVDTWSGKIEIPHDDVGTDTTGGIDDALNEAFAMEGDPMEGPGSFDYGLGDDGSTWVFNNLPKRKIDLITRTLDDYYGGLDLRDADLVITQTKDTPKTPIDYREMGNQEIVELAESKGFVLDQSFDDVMYIDQAVAEAQEFLESLGYVAVTDEFKIVHGEKAQYEEALAMIDDFDVAEGVKSDEPTQYSEYTLDAAGQQRKTKSRELLFKLPGTSFKPPHFRSDTKGYIAHVRFTERTMADGSRTVFLEEIQNDKSIAARKDRVHTLEEQKFLKENPDKDIFQSPESVRYGIREEPFLAKWQPMVLKRMLRWAAENGFDRIAWIDGEATRELYSLNKATKGVTVKRLGEAVWEDKTVYDFDPDKGFSRRIAKEPKYEITTDEGHKFVRGESAVAEVLGGDLTKEALDRLSASTSAEMKKSIDEGVVTPVEDSIENVTHWVNRETAVGSSITTPIRLDLKTDTGQKMFKDIADIKVERVKPAGEWASTPPTHKVVLETRLGIRTRIEALVGENQNATVEDAIRAVYDELGDEMPDIKHELKTAQDTTKLEGKDFDIGGLWAKKLYDEVIPNTFKQLTKKLGHPQKVESMHLEGGAPASQETRVTVSESEHLETLERSLTDPDNFTNLHDIGYQVDDVTIAFQNLSPDGQLSVERIVEQFRSPENGRHAEVSHDYADDPFGPGGGKQFQTIKISPELKADVMEGQSRFHPGVLDFEVKNPTNLDEAVSPVAWATKVMTAIHGANPPKDVWTTKDTVGDGPLKKAHYLDKKSNDKEMDALRALAEKEGRIILQDAIVKEYRAAEKDADRFTEDDSYETSFVYQKGNRIYKYYQEGSGYTGITGFGVNDRPIGRFLLRNGLFNEHFNTDLRFEGYVPERTGPFTWPSPNRGILMSQEFFPDIGETGMGNIEAHLKSQGFTQERPYSSSWYKDLGNGRILRLSDAHEGNIQMTMPPSFETWVKRKGIPPSELLKLINSERRAAGKPSRLSLPVALLDAEFASVSALRTEYDQLVANFIPEFVPLDIVTWADQYGEHYHPGTKEFKDWFGDSKVVDEKGKPLRVFRGQEGESGGEIQSRLDWGDVASISFTDKPGISDLYSMDGLEKATSSHSIPVYLSLENPVVFEDFYGAPGELLKHGVSIETLQEIALNDQAFSHELDFLSKALDRDYVEKLFKENGIEGHGALSDKVIFDGLRKLIEEKPETFFNESGVFRTYMFLDHEPVVRSLVENGHDGAIFPIWQQDIEGTEYKVFDKSKIKSTLNRGTWDPNDPKIRHHPGAEDKVKMDIIDAPLQKDSTLARNAKTETMVEDVEGEPGSRYHPGVPFEKGPEEVEVLESSSSDAINFVQSWLNTQEGGRDFIQELEEMGVDFPRNYDNLKRILETNTAEVSREDMPIIQPDQFNQFTEFASEALGKDVKLTKRAVPAKNLKPWQTQIFFPKTTWYSLQKYKHLKEATTDLGNKEFSLISSDGFIVDGNHRWAQTMLMAPDTKLKGTQVNLSMDELMPLAQEFSQTTGNDRATDFGGVRHHPGVDDKAYLEVAEAGDTETAQKLVDKAAKDAGYTVGPVYHGTSEYGFTTFDQGKLGSNTGATSAKEAFFFSDDEMLASGYRHTSEGDSFSDLTSKIQETQSRLDSIEEASRGKSVKEILEISEKQYQPLKAELDAMSAELHAARMQRGSIIESGGTPEAAPGSGIYTVQLRAKNPFTVDFKGQSQRPESFASIIKEAKLAGHDSVIFKNTIDSATPEHSVVSNVYAVFDSNQIKSADPITRDDQGNIIPLSERFDVGQDDTRYHPGSEERKIAKGAEAIPSKAADGWLLPDGTSWLSARHVDHESTANKWVEENSTHPVAKQILDVKNNRPGTKWDNPGPEDIVRRSDAFEAGLVRIVLEGDGVDKKIHAQGKLNQAQKKSLEMMAIQSNRSLYHDRNLEHEGLWYNDNSKAIYETPEKLESQVRYHPGVTLDKDAPMLARDILGNPNMLKVAKTKAEVASLLREGFESQFGDVVKADDMDESDIRWLGDQLVHEAVEAFGKTGNAVDWYTKAVERTLDMAEERFPELANRGAEYHQFLGAIAMTSQNMRVYDNLKAALHQYQHKQEHGKFDYTTKHGEKGDAITGNLKQFDILEETLGTDGLGDFIKKDFSVKELSEYLSELLNRDVKIAGYSTDIIKGSAAFGPKIGQGFFQNLLGNYDPVTVDLWLRRTFGRLTGDVVRPEITPGHVGRLISAIRKNTGKMKMEGLELPEFLSGVKLEGKYDIQGKSKHRISQADFDRLFDQSTEEGASNALAIQEIGERLKKGWETVYQGPAKVKSKVVSELKKDIQTFRSEYRQADKKLTSLRVKLKKKVAQLKKTTAEKAKETLEDSIKELTKEREVLTAKRKSVKDKLETREKGLQKKIDALDRKKKTATDAVTAKKPEWAFIGNTLGDLKNPVDAPSDRERAVIAQAFEAAREKLKADFDIDITNADLQALLWYPEKDIWAHLQGKSSNLNEDYASAMEKILNE